MLYGKMIFKFLVLRLHSIKDSLLRKSYQQRLLLLQRIHENRKAIVIDKGKEETLIEETTRISNLDPNKDSPMSKVDKKLNYIEKNLEIQIKITMKDKTQDRERAAEILKEIIAEEIMMRIIQGDQEVLAQLEEVATEKETEKGGG